MLKVIDLKNNPYPAQATVNRKQIVNGEQTLSLSFSISDINMDFLPDLSYLWKAEFDKEQYTIINPSTEAIIKRKSITAILKFFTDFGSMYLQDDVEDKSMTALNAYTELFANTGKRVHLVDNFYSNTLNYSKNESRLERFHYYNERFKAEFIVRGDDVYLYNKIGSYKPDIRIDEDLNVKSATVDIDSENFFTWCKCYYDLEESEGSEEKNYRKEKVYKDDNLYAIYGDIEGPALYQGNIRNETTMLEYAEDVQRKSIKVSHSVELIDLQNQGYEEFIFHIGDVIRLSLSSINTTVDIRIVDIDETWVENDLGQWEQTDLKLTLGETSKVQSYKSSQSGALQDLQDWLDGRKSIPPDLLTPAFQRAADVINGDTDSVMEYRKDRLAGHHSRNEGNRVQLNVSGLQYVRNGVPGNALTFEGLFVDNATTGMLSTHNVLIQGTEGHFTMDGDMLKAVDYNDSEKYVELSAQRGLRIEGGMLRVGRDDGGYPTIIAGRSTHGQRLFGSTPHFMHPLLEVSGQRVRNDSSEMRTIDAYYFEHYFNGLKVYVAFRNNGDEMYRGRVGVVGFGGTEVNHTQSIDVPPNSTEYLVLRPSIGIPDGSTKQFYIQFACLTTNKTALISILDVKNVDL